jgi:hypothetical protein
MAKARAPRREARPAPPFSLTGGWAALVLALLTVLFFHEVVVGGRTFVSPDATAPAGFVRMGERSLYQDHVYPLWNPFVFLGMPSFASGTYNPLIYPPDWPVALLQKALPLPDLTWMLIYYLLAGFFMFLLAREWGARPEGALLAGAAFVFAPNLIAVGSHGHGSQLVGSAYIPLILWLATRWMRRGGVAHLGWLALAGGFQMLRGHVQVSFYAWIAVALYAAIEWIATLRRPAELPSRTARAAGIALAAALAFGLAGFYNLPLWDYARWSIRGGAEGGGVGMSYATQWSLAPYELLSVVVPGWVGFGGATYWGSMPFTDYPNAYLGIVTVLLALPAFLSGGVPRAFAVVLAGSALLVSFGRHLPLYGFLYDHLPLFNKFRVPVMVIILLQVSACLGLAWGWSSALDRGGTKAERGSGLERLLLGAGAVLAAALVLGVLGQGLWRERYIAAATALRGAGEQPFPRQLAELACQGFVRDLGRACLLGLATVGIAWLAVRGKLAVSISTVGILVLLLLELWPVSSRLMQPVLGDPIQGSMEFGRDDVVEFLEKAGGPGAFRVFPVQEFQSNRYAGFGIASVGGYHAAKPRLAQDFLQSGLATHPLWMRLLNVRYIVSPQPLDPVPDSLRQVHSGSQVIYENLLALPRATVVGRYRVVTPAKAILDSVSSGTSESAEVTFLERDPHLTLGPVTGARAEIVSYRLNDVTVDVDTPGPGLLRLADLWYPDWIATVDGRPAQVLRADDLLRAVPVPAGRHRVVFRYESPSVRRGLVLSLASLVLVLLLFVGDRVLRARRRPGGSPTAAAPEGA